MLEDDVSEMPKNWNRRFKHNRDKIKTGDIYELAEVVRNLAIREHHKGLSTGEKQMFTRAKKILASELMYALDKDEDGGRGAPGQPAAGVRGREGRHRLGGWEWRSRSSWPRVVANALGRRPQGVRQPGGPADGRMVVAALRAVSAVTGIVVALPPGARRRPAPSASPGAASARTRCARRWPPRPPKRT